ncbi:hypothetical protein IGI04_019203 [Brassica rapa subsp. trilocularis]|uniref:Uncharacterized protein n=1 Tax=Brassica rapa subsp. trilocularis TaxID=1813537 RepID=A0ABQ7MF59_BRACM|nr:hypothetical protein IGI04_019203 [Brassica rapa subsp. trilocularis]
MAATKIVFHHMVLIFHSFKGKSINFRYVFFVFYKGFSDLNLDMRVFLIWKSYGLEDFQTTSRKSYRRLPGGLLTESSPMSIFLLHAFNQMVLIFHLDMYFVCSIKVYLSNFPLIFSVLKPFERFLILYAGFSDLDLIYMFLSGSDFERPMGSLLGSLPKYNALEDFQEVFQTTSKKSSRRLPSSLLMGSSSISSGTTYTEVVRPMSYMEVVQDKQGLTRISE